MWHLKAKSQRRTVSLWNVTINWIWNQLTRSRRLWQIVWWNERSQRFELIPTWTPLWTTTEECQQLLFDLLFSSCSPPVLLLFSCFPRVHLLSHSETTCWMKWRTIKIIQNQHIVFCQLSQLHHLCTPHITFSASKHTSGIMGNRLVSRAQFREGEKSSNNYNSLCMCVCACVAVWKHHHCYSCSHLLH